MEKEKGHRTVDVFSYAYGTVVLRKSRLPFLTDGYLACTFSKAAVLSYAGIARVFLGGCQSVPLHKLLHLLKPYLQKPVLILFWVFLKLLPGQLNPPMMVLEPGIHPV